jgi:hypothetical protein
MGLTFLKRRGKSKRRRVRNFIDPDTIHPHLQ